MLNLLDFQKEFGEEKQCLQYLEKVRWGKGRFCPHCKSEKTYKFTDGILFKCADCQKQFTVKVSTIFSDSKIPLTKWFMVVYLATSLKKGISSMQVSRYVGVTQKTAWFMLQRIRYAFEKSSSSNKYDLRTVVEVNETYVGGKGGNNKRGRGSENKTPVVGIAQREGYMHAVINRSAKEYVNGDIHTNTIEGFWSHLKKCIDGICHHISPKHLQKYCKEYEYRYNTRILNDYDRLQIC